MCLCVGVIFTTSVNSVRVYAFVRVFQVTWQSHEQGELPNMETLNGSNPPTTYLITNLQRLTMYTIVIYATNEKGRGVDSEEMNISTSAVGELVLLCMWLVALLTVNMKVLSSSLTLT